LAIPLQQFFSLQQFPFSQKPPSKNLPHPNASHPPSPSLLYPVVNKEVEQWVLREGCDVTGETCIKQFRKSSCSTSYSCPILQLGLCRTQPAEYWVLMSS
jgi:hypothetical protein